MTAADRIAAILAAEDVGARIYQAAGFRLVSEAPHHSTRPAMTSSGRPGRSLWLKRKRTKAMQ